MIIDFRQRTEFVVGRIASAEGNGFDRGAFGNPLCNIKNSAGISVQFVSDSPFCNASYCLNLLSQIPQHSGMYLTNGISYLVYRKLDEKPILADGLYNRDNVEKRVNLYNNIKKEVLTYRLFFPSLSQVKAFSIEIEDDSFIKPLPALSENIVFLGGSLTEGCGCTFVNAMYSQIISRRLGYNMYNLCLKDNSFCNPAIAHYVAKVKPTYIITEAIPTCARVDYLEGKLKPYLQALLSVNPTAKLIIIIPPFWGDNSTKMVEKTSILTTVLRELKMEYPFRIYTSDASTFQGIPYDRYSYSSYFFNDYANYLLANKLVCIMKSTK